MSEQPKGLLADLGNKVYLRRWARAASQARGMTPERLQTHRDAAFRLRTQLDRLIHIADDRLTQSTERGNKMQVPHNADWSWRPDLWRVRLPVPGIAPVVSQSRLGENVGVFHDCAWNEISLRQLRTTQADDLAAFGLQVEVFQFTGSYLSLAIDLPVEASEGLQKRHLIRCDALVNSERGIDMYARLNVLHGPNTEQLVRAVPMGNGPVSVEFDLAYTELNEKRVEKVWLDLILQDPAMNRITLRDLTFSRRPRAEI